MKRVLLSADGEAVVKVVTSIPRASGYAMDNVSNDADALVQVHGPCLPAASPLDLTLPETSGHSPIAPAAGVTMLRECRYCNAPSSRLYFLPARLRPEQRAAGPACYFCYIRATGIKPTRRQLTGAAVGGTEAGA